MKANMTVRMNMNPTCFDCIRRGFLKHLTDCPEPVQKEFLERFTALAKRLGDNLSSPALYYEGRKLLHEYVPDTDPEVYLPIKKAFNDALLAMEDELQARLDSSDSRLELALKLARSGNYLDTSCVKDINYDKLRELIDRTSEEVLDSHALACFRADLEAASSLVYFTDNAGEAVLDKLLIRTLRHLYPALDITVIVRGGLAQSDITLEDAESIGLTKEAHVIGSGVPMPGVQLSYVPDDVLSVIENADVLLAKEQGNLESLGGCGLNIYYLFLCKCHMFTERFRLPQFTGCFLREQEL